MTEWGRESLGNCVPNSLRFTWEKQTNKQNPFNLWNCTDRWQQDASGKSEKTRCPEQRCGKTWWLLQLPPLLRFLLDTAATTSCFAGFADHRPLSWVVAAASRVAQAPCTFCIALRFIKTFQTPKKVRKACSACMEEPMLPQGREGA